MNGRPYLVTTSAPTDRQPGQSAVNSVAGAKITVTVGDFWGSKTSVHVKVEAGP